MNLDSSGNLLALAELNRLTTFFRYSILDTKPEKNFDEITQLAARLCETPIALISLVDSHRQWFKSKVGFETTETPRDISFCAYAIQDAQMLIVSDTLENPRFANNPLVLGEPYIRFYAGAPLTTPEGEILGTLCVIDVVPRSLTSDQIEALEVLSRQVMAQLELRRKLKESEQIVEASCQREQALRQEVQERQRAEAKLQVSLYQHQQAEAELAAKTKTLNVFNTYLKKLHCLSTYDYSSFENLCTDYLQVGRQILGCQTGIISRIEDQAYTVIAVQTPASDLRCGNVFALADTYCTEVIRQASTISYARMGAIAPIKDHLCYQHLDLESYIGTAIWVNGSIYGTLNFSSTQGRSQDFTTQDREILELMAASIGKFIAINQAETQIRQQTQTLHTALTDLKEAQSHIVQQAKTSSLGILAGGVAHEINNPVNFISGNIRYLQKACEDLIEFIVLYQTHDSSYEKELQRRLVDLDWDFLQQDLPKLFNSINLGVGRVRSIVSALQSFVRQDEAGLKTIDVHHSLDNTLLLLRHRLNKTPKQFAIQVIKHYGQLPQIEGYPSALNQVFINILTNAIDAIAYRQKKYAAPDDSCQPGNITVRTRILDKNWIEIAIVDNGQGIDPGVQPHIFDPFFTTKPVGKGAGLGLSISYRLVEQHGGLLRCNTSRDQGAEFVIQIPVQQK